MTFLRKRKIVIGKNDDVIYTQYNIRQAIENRDTFAKFLYEWLFKWIIKKLNVFTAPEPSKDSSNTRKIFIGILDVFGFENFTENSLEQLCINFANEKLQELFVNEQLRDESRLYEEEGIDFPSFEGKGRSYVLNMFETRPIGLFPTIEMCCKLRFSTEETLAQQIVQNEPHFEQLKCSPRSYPNFSVVHFAGEVEYSPKNFLAKNRDNVGEGAKELLHHCGWEFIKEIAGGESFVISAEERSPVTEKFRHDLSNLQKKLKSTQMHFVKCIKSNVNSEPMIYEEPFIIRQLQICGIFQLIKVRKNGFPYKMTHKDFCRRYLQFMPQKCKMKESTKDAKSIVRMFGLNAQIGKTMVFFHDRDHEKLEEIRIRKIAFNMKAIRIFAESCVSRKNLMLLIDCQRELRKAMKKQDLGEIVKSAKRCIENGLDPMHKILEMADKITKESNQFSDNKKEITSTNIKSAKKKPINLPNIVEIKQPKEVIKIPKEVIKTPKEVIKQPKEVIKIPKEVIKPPKEIKQNIFEIKQPKEEIKQPIKNQKSKIDQIKEKMHLENKSNQNFTHSKKPLQKSSFKKTQSIPTPSIGPPSLSKNKSQNVSKLTKKYENMLNS